MKKKISISIIILVILALLGIVIYQNYANAPAKTELPIKEVAMPTYAKNEIINVEKRIKEISDKNSISFSYLTDIHGDKEIFAPISNIQAFKQIGNDRVLDFGVCAGDITTGAYEDFKSGKALTNLEYFSKEIKDTEIEILFARGNHDCNTRADASVALSGQQYYETVLKDLNGKVTFNNEDLSGDYYYKDLEDKKIRICVLNAFNGANYEFVFGKKQLEFVQSEVLDLSDKSNPNEWQVLFVTHTVDETTAHREVPSDSQKLYDAINKFQNDGGTVIAIIAGHHHMDTTLIKNNILVITVRSASVNYDRGEYNAETFSEEDLCFDVFTIDKENKTLYATRVGRGADRKWSYDTNNLNKEIITRETTDMMEETKEENIKVETVKNYNGQTIAIVTSNVEFKEKTNQTWKLSKDKKTYTKILDDVEMPYTTTFTNINGYSITHTF